MPGAYCRGPAAPVLHAPSSTPPALRVWGVESNAACVGSRAIAMCVEDARFGFQCQGPLQGNSEGTAPGMLPASVLVSRYHCGLSYKQRCWHAQRHQGHGGIAGCLLVFGHTGSSTKPPAPFSFVNGPMPVKIGTAASPIRKLLSSELCLVV